MNKNPLAVVFGIALRHLRARSGGISSEEVAGRIGISPSNYRLLEAGSTNLQPFRILPFVRVFDEIDFAALATFVAVTETLASSLAREVETPQALDEFKEVHPDLGPLLGKISELSKKPLSEDEFRKEAQKQKLVNHLLDFLRGSPVTKPREVESETLQSIATLCKRVSPFAVEAFEHSISQFVGMTLRFTPFELYLFEDNNWRRFTSVTAVVRNTDLLLATTALDAKERRIQGYRYLWHSEFSKLLVLHLCRVDSVTLKREFLSALKRDLAQQPDIYRFELKNFGEAEFKVEFAPARPQDVAERILHYNGDRMNHFWLYKLQHRAIGFIDNAENKQSTRREESAKTGPTGDILSLEETLAREREIREHLAPAS